MALFPDLCQAVPARLRKSRMLSDGLQNHACMGAGYQGCSYGAGADSVSRAQATVAEFQYEKPSGPLLGLIVMSH
jgi:hypothetical protein